MHNREDQNRREHSQIFDRLTEVRHLEKYLSRLNRDDLQKSCMFLESIIKPYFDKNKETLDKINDTKISSNQDASAERHLNVDSPQITNFDSEQTFTEKFLTSVQDDTFLTDTFLIPSKFLEEKNTESKGHCFDKVSQNSGIKLSPNPVVSEDNLKYDISFKNNCSLSNYLDLSHKATILQQIKIQDSTFPSLSQNKNLENNSEFILNLCSKNRTLNLKDSDKEMQNEVSNISEEFDNISYINSSNILLEEKLLEKTDSINSNPDMNNLDSKSHIDMIECNVTKSQTSFRDDIGKILTPHFSANISVIHSTHSLKEDKKVTLINNHFNSYMSKEDTSISLVNENSKTCFDNRSENSEILSIDCDANGILNLKKEPLCVEREICTRKTLSQDSNSLNVGFYALVNSLESFNKKYKDSCKQDETENGIKALNLVNRKSKTKNLSDNMQESDCRQIKKYIIKDSRFGLINVGDEVKAKENATYSSVKVKNNKNGSVSCWKCQVEFADVSLWNEHNYLGSCGNLLYCSHCDIHFKSKTVHKQHILCHKRNTCARCPSTFRRRQLLRAHMKLEHGITLVSKTFPCEHCSRVFMKRSSIYYHLQNHALPNQKVCPKCGKFIEGEAAYTDHMNEHVKNAFFKCSICSSIFERHQQYNDHMEGHKRHVCTYCESKLISFSSKKLLFKHYKTEHPDLPQKVILNKKYSCDQCSKVFTRPSLLQDHKRTHNGMLRYECRLCNKKYALRSSLRKHLKAAHYQNEKRPNICQYCNLSFPSISLLDKHSNTVHNSFINYSCTLCDFKTGQLKGLKRHMDKHVESKKFLCDICGSMFQCSTTLKHHKLFLHSDERKFKCKECDKSFKNRSCLSRHLRTHSSERPYKCECGSCFKQPYHLVRHLSTAHNKKANSKKSRTAQNEDDVEEQNLCFSQGITVATADTNTPVVSEVERSSNDILLTSGNTVIMSETSVAQEPSPLFTVLDSQLIHLIPSTLQLQEGLHTVSLVNGGEIHTLSIAPPTYQISQGEGFASSSASDTIIIHSSQAEAIQSLSLQDVQTETATITENKINISKSLNANMNNQKTSSPQITLEQEHGIQFASSTLADLQYRENMDENESIHSLATTHYLTHQESSLGDDIGANNISIF